MGMSKNWCVCCNDCGYERKPESTYKDVLITRLKEEGWTVKRVNNWYLTICPSCKNKGKSMGNQE